ncbi:MAG: hypothetical protein ACRDCB_10235 [Clostridium sp.]
MIKIDRIIYEKLNTICGAYKFDLPTEYDFNKNNLGIYYLLKEASAELYKKNITIEIHILCLEKDYELLLKSLEQIEELFGNKIIEGIYFTHKKIFMVQVPTKNKTMHYILKYVSNEY